jgi:hypothetical protein
VIAEFEAGAAPAPSTARQSQHDVDMAYVASLEATVCEACQDCWCCFRFRHRPAHGRYTTLTTVPWLHLH